MPAEKAIAIVLRVVEFSETSAVVVLFTREFGKIRGLAKGAWRPKGPFNAALDLLSLCRIVFLRKSSGVLDLLTEARLERRFRPSGRDMAGFYAAYYVAELLNELTDDHDPHPELFDLAEKALSDLGSGQFVAEVVLRFELSALHWLGHMPSLDRCVTCGENVPDKARVAFSRAEGGVLCNQCRGKHRQVILVSLSVIQAMRRLSTVPFDDSLKGSEIDSKTYGELRAVLNSYVCHLLGKRPKLHKYLTQISLTCPATSEPEKG